MSRKTNRRPSSGALIGPVRRPCAVERAVEAIEAVEAAEAVEADEPGRGGEEYGEATSFLNNNLPRTSS